MFDLTTHSAHFLFTVIWRRTYVKGPQKPPQKTPTTTTLVSSFIICGT